MIKIENVLRMEQELKDSLSLGFFEHRTHADMDLIIYKAYDAVQYLRMMMGEYERGLRETAEEIIEDYKREKGE